MSTPGDTREGSATFTKRRLLGGTFLVVIVSIAVYGALIGAADTESMLDALRALPTGSLLFLLLIATAGICLRAARWHWLMRVAGHPAPLRDSFYVHLSSQAMGVSPGRIGEALKPWLSRLTGGMPLSSGFTLVFSERVADLLGVVILSTGALSLLAADAWPIAVVSLALILLLIGARSHRLRRIGSRFASRNSNAATREEIRARVAATLDESLSLKRLIPSVGVSLAVWGLEGAGLALCVRMMGADGLGFDTAISAYSVSILAGAVSFVPGGLGLTEASMAGLLVMSGIAAPVAAAATLVMRLVTLWWGVVLGWLVFASRPRLLRAMFAGIVEPQTPR